MKYLYNPATDEFESLTPTLRDRFALGGGVIQGEKVAGRENFAEPTSYPTRDYILKKLEKSYDIGEIVRDFAKENNIDIFGGTREDVPKARRNLNAAVRRKIYGGQRMLPDKELVSLLENNIKNSNPDVVQKQFTNFVNKNKNKYLNKKGGTEKLYEDAVKWFKKNNPAGLLTYDGTQVRTLRPNQEVIRLKSGEGSIEASYKRGRQEIREIISPSEGVGPSRQKSKYARLDEAWEMAADSLNMSTKDYKNLLQKYITRPAQRIIPELTGTKYAAGPEHIYGLRQAIGTSLKKEMIKSATNVSPAPREFNSFVKGPQLDKRVTGMIDNAFNTNDIGKRRKIIESANTEINLFAKKFPGTYPKYVVDKVGNIKDVNLNKINLKAKKTTDIGTEYIDYLLKTPGFTKSKEYKNLPKESKELIDTRKSGDVKKFKELIKNKVDSLRKQGVTLFSKLERGSPARKILESIPGAPGKFVDAAVITPFDFFSSIAAGYNLPESAAIAASNLLPKSVQKVLPATLATYDTQREMTDKFEPVFNLSGGEETKFGKKIREGLGETIDKIKNKFGDEAIGTADDVPEPESAERKRMFDDANERFNEMEIPEIDGQFMAAEGGRVNFGEGSPDPDFINMAIAADQNDNIPIEDKTFLGMKLADNPLQRFNEMIDPRAYPYYGQKISEGASRIPEYAGRTIFAALQTVGDLIKGRRTGKMDRFVEAITPAATNKAQEAIGLTKLIEDTEKNRTGAQKQYGEGLEFLAEVPGPATPIAFLLKTPKYFRQLRGLAGSTQAAKELENKMQEKIAVDQSRRDFNMMLGAGGVMAVVKALGLDKLIPVGSKVAQKTTPIVTPGGTPKYFFDFVNLIKSKGDDISETAATIERQKVYGYKGYELTEDLTTGEKSIKIADEDMGKGSEMTFKPGEDIVDEKTGKSVKSLDEYEEYSYNPDASNPGKFDSQEGMDDIDEILELLRKDGKKYSKTELEDMGINFDAGKPEKAGGGIMKLAGDDSGPPPTSGPNSEGLALILKRDRKY